MHHFVADTDNEEVWNESRPDSDDYLDDCLEPELPSFSATTEHYQSTVLSQWFMRYMLILQTQFYLPDNALDLLIKFLYAFFNVIGQFSSVIKALVKALPPTLYVMRKKTIGLKNSFQKLVVCKRCLHIYEYSKCINALSHSSRSCTYVKYPNHPHYTGRQPCGSILLKSVEFTSGQTILYPFMIYCYMSLKQSLQNLLLSNEFYSNCQLWHNRVVENDCLNEIYDGLIWKQFFDASISSFNSEYSFAFALNVDWFQPYTHTTASIGAIYLTVLNLPRYIRYKRENVILLGIIPGPNEPKYNINSFLKPIVDELQQLWVGINLTVCSSSSAEQKIVTVKGAILCVTCDIPAGRKVCGFLGHSATLGCSKCLKKFAGGVGKKDYSGFNRSEWTKRTNETHKNNVSEIQKCRTKTQQEEAESKYGCRYSCLTELPYFDAPRMLCIDIMHNLFLGTGKHMIFVWLEQQLLTKDDFKTIQNFVDSMHIPSDIGRIPLKIGSSFAGFTADQFKTWINIFSIPALSEILPPEHLECWRHYVLACRILCKQSLSRTDIDLADCLLLRFCNKVEILYGKHVITPNMHLHAHLKEMILDYGPSQELWLFSFERYNGLLGKQPTNNRAIEPQLMQTFLRSNAAILLPCPQEFKEELGIFEAPDRTVGSVNETLTGNNFTLPSKFKRKALHSLSINTLKQLYCKIKTTEPNHVVPNSIIIKYSSVTLKGKVFSTSKKKDDPYVAFAQWSENLFGAPPTQLPDSYLPTTNIRPVDVKYYFKATFIVHNTTISLIFAYVSWFLPHQQRYAMGKPVELWYDRLYECSGMHTFLPIDRLMCRCAYATVVHNHENLMAVVPIVE